MPELPEVQTTVSGLQKYMKGHTIKEVWTDYNSPFHVGKDNIKNPLYFKKFTKQIVGQKVIDVSRRAKNILIHLSNEHTILIHMKMTGHVMVGNYVFDSKKKEWVSQDAGPLRDPFNRFIHLVFTLSNGKNIVLSDMRKFAKVMYLPTRDIAHLAELKKLGPEPLEKNFSLEDFKTRLSKKPTGKIKTTLMDQEIIAGIGNIYSDEILWVAGVNPEERVENIPAKNLALMYDAMKEILQRSIKLGGDSMSDYRNIEGEKGGFHPYHNAYRQHGKACTRKNCGGTIRRKVVATRSAHYCDVHQALFKK